jgi:serine/threonine-protein kinase RsbT
MPFTAIEELVTAVSEIARNVIDHAGEGELLAGTLQHEGRAALLVIAEDRGPGIANVGAALVDGFSTGTGLGLGLSSASRFVDAFEIDSRLDRGTTVTLTKWIDRPR